MLTYLLTTVAVTVGVVQVLFFPEHLSIIAIEVVAMLLSLAAVQLVRHCYWHDRWLYSRQLAEQLRIAMFTLVLPDDPSEPLNRATRVLPFYGGPDHWLSSVVRWTIQSVTAECSGSSINDPPDDAQFKTIKRYVIDGWLRVQSEHHARTAHRKHVRDKRGRSVIVSLFTLTLVAAMLHWFHVGAGTTADRAITAAAISVPA